MTISLNNKKAQHQADLLRRLQKCLEQPENQTCAECSEPNPSWASLLATPAGVSSVSISSSNHKADKKSKKKGSSCMGVFCCYKCCSYHFSLGREICAVKNIKIAEEWTEEEVRAMEKSGNHLVSVIFEGGNAGYGSLIGQGKSEREAQEERAQYVETKYKELKFFDRKAYKEHERYFKLLALGIDSKQKKEKKEEKREKKEEKKKEKLEKKQEKKKEKLEKKEEKKRKKEGKTTKKDNSSKEAEEVAKAKNDDLVDTVSINTATTSITSISSGSAPIVLDQLPPPGLLSRHISQQAPTAEDLGYEIPEEDTSNNLSSELAKRGIVSGANRRGSVGRRFSMAREEPISTMDQQQLQQQQGDEETDRRGSVGLRRRSISHTEGQDRRNSIGRTRRSISHGDKTETHGVDLAALGYEELTMAEPLPISLTTQLANSQIRTRRLSMTNRASIGARTNNTERNPPAPPRPESTGSLSLAERRATRRRESIGRCTSNDSGPPRRRLSIGQRSNSSERLNALSPKSPRRSPKPTASCGALADLQKKISATSSSRTQRPQRRGSVGGVAPATEKPHQGSSVSLKSPRRSPKRVVSGGALANLQKQLERDSGTPRVRRRGSVGGDAPKPARTKRDGSVLPKTPRRSPKRAASGGALAELDVTATPRTKRETSAGSSDLKKTETPRSKRQILKGTSALKTPRSSKSSEARRSRSRSTNREPHRVSSHGSLLAAARDSNRQKSPARCQSANSLSACLSSKRNPRSKSPKRSSRSRRLPEQATLTVAKDDLLGESSNNPQTKSRPHIDFSSASALKGSSMTEVKSKGTNSRSRSPCLHDRRSGGTDDMSSIGRSSGHGIKKSQNASRVDGDSSSVDSSGHTKMPRMGARGSLGKDDGSYDGSSHKISRRGARASMEKDDAAVDDSNQKSQNTPGRRENPNGKEDPCKKRGAIPSAEDLGYGDDTICNPKSNDVRSSGTSPAVRRGSVGMAIERATAVKTAKRQADNSAQDRLAGSNALAPEVSCS